MKLRILITNPDDRTIIECTSKEDFLTKLSEMIDHAESDNGTHFDAYVYSNGYMFGIYTNKISPDTPSLSPSLIGERKALFDQQLLKYNIELMNQCGSTSDLLNDEESG